MPIKTHLVVFSHLRWNFVYQRPQQILSRLAKNQPVLFIEEPVECPEIDSPRWTTSEPASNVTVLVPNVPSPVFTPHFHNPAVKELVQKLASSLGERPILWLYTPSAVMLLDCFSPALTVYDCMDELSAFLHAPQELRDQEKRLLASADLVFTGGPSLYRAKKGLHPEVYCFPSSVDLAHFRDGVQNASEAADQAPIPSPRLGFFGVIDERLDLPLLAHLAESRPEWQIVLVGPVVKIDPASLPRLPNIHYLGGRPYSELPSYVKGWDICMMPFAMNDSTRFISPTKVLEYMAADKPIVSTPITDVVEPYGAIVRIGNGPAEFLDCCQAALHAAEQDWHTRRADAGKVVAATSWNKTAEAMATLIHEKLAKDPTPLVEPMVVVAGAGPAGLSAAYHLGDRALVVEPENRVGGWCRSMEVNGFTFDFARHILFSSEPYVHQMYNVLLGSKAEWQDRDDWLNSYGGYPQYPFEESLSALPPQVIAGLTGTMNVSEGLPSETNGTRVQERRPDLTTETPLASTSRSHAFGTPADPVEAGSKSGGKTPAPKVRFGYPLRGGSQALMDSFLPHLKGRVLLGTSIVSLDSKARTARLSDGATVHYSHLVSTLPIAALVRLLGPQAPAAVQAASAKIRSVSVRCIHIGIGRQCPTGKHWVYRPEDTIFFHRIVVQGNSSPSENVADGFALTCEITYSPHNPLPCDGEELTALAIQECIRVGLFTLDDPIVTAFQVDMPCAYVVYDHERKEAVELIRHWLLTQNITLAGEYSEWEYYNSDHAFIAGKKAADEALRHILPARYHSGPSQRTPVETAPEETKTKGATRT